MRSVADGPPRPSFGQLFLGDRVKEDSGENYDSPGPEARCHFVQVAKEKEGDDDAVNRFEISDKRYPEGRKFAHNIHTGNVCNRCTDGSQQEEAPKISCRRYRRPSEASRNQ